MKQKGIEEFTPEDIGQARAAKLVALWEGLLKAGVDRGVAEKIASNVSGAASCNADGCHCALARLPLVSQFY